MTDKIAWRIKTSNLPIKCKRGVDIALSLDLVAQGSGTDLVYIPYYEGSPLAEILVVFLDDNENDFKITFTSTTPGVDVDRKEYETIAPTLTGTPTCDYTIQSDASGTTIEVTVGNYKEVAAGGVIWTLDETAAGSPPAELKITVKRKNDKPSC